MIDLSAHVALACASGAVVALWIGFQRAGWLATQGSLTAIGWRADGRWLLTDRRGRSLEGRLCSESRVGRHALWLRWYIEHRAGARKRTLLLVRGDVPDAELRRLVVRLRLEGLRPDIHAGSREAATETSMS